MTEILTLGGLAITYVALAGLVPDPNNPRQHSARQIRQIARSIRAFGYIVPILIDCHNRIVAGHGRYLAAQLRIADNRLTEMSSWDDRLLTETLKELSELELDFSIEATGFTMGEIDLRIEAFSATDGDRPDPADQLSGPTEKAPVSVPGDQWRLGRHRLLCGNALDGCSFQTLMMLERANIVFTDPPWNVRIRGHASGRGRIRHREFAMATGELDVVEFTSFLTRCCALMAKYSVGGSIHFVCMDWRHAGELLEAGRLAYAELKNVCVWVKDNGGLGSLYRSQHELVFVFKHGSPSHRNNVQLGQYGRNRTNVWHYPCANTFSRQSEEGYLSALHPTVKPVAMVADAILDCSARGDVVLDPFMGSGTTLIAAERVGRRCYGMEIDPLYVDTIIRRWQAYTGETATHAVTGRIFNDLVGQVEADHD